MPQPIQTGEDALRLARRFGIVGRLPLLLDEVVIPVVSIDLEATPDPWLGYEQRPAGAVFGHLNVDPGLFSVTELFAETTNLERVYLIDSIINQTAGGPITITPLPNISPGGLPVGRWRDASLPGEPTMQFRGNEGIGFGVDPVWVLGPGEQTHDMGIVLGGRPQAGPGVMGVQFTCQVAGDDALVAVMWRELTPARG